MTTLSAAPSTRDRTSLTIPGGTLAAIAGPLALAGSNACFAVLTRNGHAQDSRDYLDLVAGNRALVEIGAALGLLACLLIVPAIWAVVGRLRAGGSRLASVGGWLMASGYVMGVALSVEALMAVSVAGSSQSSSGFIDGVDNQGTITATAMYMVFGLGALLGGLILGVAMLRTPGLPRWFGIALIASEPVRVIGLLTGVDALTAVASLLILVSFVGVVRRQ